MRSLVRSAFNNNNASSSFSNRGKVRFAAFVKKFYTLPSRRCSALTKFPQTCDNAQLHYAMTADSLVLALQWARIMVPPGNRLLEVTKHDFVEGRLPPCL